MARYFVHLPADGSAAIFWRSLSSAGGDLIHINLNLLAYAVGDEPATLLRGKGALVPVQDYVRFGSGAVVIPAIQPFVVTRPDGSIEGLPVAGSNLNRFLDDPLDGERMDLSLPFYDEAIKLGTKGGGWFRNNNDESAFHGGTDVNTVPASVFDVCAAAGGTVRAAVGGFVVLSHKTSSGREFRTVYEDMDPGSLLHSAGDAVRRGELLGSTNPAKGHLHFGVAVQVTGGRRTLNGVRIDRFWYFVDPWGVYDFRPGNYLPTTGRIFESPIVGVTHAVLWRTQPVFKTLPIARSTTGYHAVVRVQVRARQSTDFGGTLPAETEQFLVWLEGDDEFFAVPLSQAGERTMELELVTLLREACLHGRSVRLEYRYIGDLRYIMAAWVNA